ncbi:hypothetical protein U9M48_013662 [Paspalum notatum var. saurae]|uniref:Zinc finger PHD-type domain-containing protein n=1 Tax=Paspalum notatum var. saurae TaxID=547442 RepID=A0AAQ3WJR9_PASNO
MSAMAVTMMSDDDDAEPQLNAVDSYYFLDSLNQPVCFSTLPLRLGDDDIPECKKRLGLRGTADPGIKVYKEVVAWRLELEGKQPHVMVLAADGGGWIRLVKPKNSYEKMIRSVLITMQMLHFLKRKPDEPDKNLWSHLRKVFDKFDDRPSEDDFRNHCSLMKQFASRDPVLAKSEILRAFLEGRSRKNISEVGADNIEVKKPFIADDGDIDEIVMEDVNSESDEEEDEDLFESICAICDNGGDLLCCDGPCMRSFHAKKGTGEDSYCGTLGYTEEEVEAMNIFLCKNCEYKQHQCFICGVLEPSDGAVAKVFLCNNATCGHFYHPKCVAHKLHPNSRNEASELEKKITEGFSFTCPIHWCFHCKGLEDRTKEPLQFAVCRRCPKSYHRKCLPREISFEDTEEDFITRAWELSKRILIYCLDHEIDSDIETPVRNHIKFPKIEKTHQYLKKGDKLLVNKKKRTYSDSVCDQPSKDNMKMKSRVHVQEGEQNKQTTREVSEKNSTENLVYRPEKKKAKLVKKIQLPDVPNDPSLSSPLPQEQELAPLPSSASRKIPQSSFPTVDSEIEKRVISIVRNEGSSLTLNDITRKCSVPSTHVYSGRQAERIPQGKIERSIQAVGAALKKLENGGNANDARAVCEPDVLRQLAKWHIVDKLHWYVEPGDMIVDFCCGANDFSWLMKEKLDKVQKKCNFKNYDLIQPQNRFCFEKRDWMTVQPGELPHGSQLIMGLNPPFGVKASLANKFIDKALTFKPKLIVLIVPKETKRLDQKRTPYDLIWEDNECLAGKAFYLPGSVDLNDKTVEGWNASAPPLYLWSHPDWTKKHKKLAEEHSHSCRGNIACHVEETILSDDHVKTSSYINEGDLFHGLPMRKQAEHTKKWNSKRGKKRKSVDKTRCNDRQANILDECPDKKPARSEEEKENLVKIAVHVKEASISDNLPVNKQTEAGRKVISQSGKQRANDRYDNRRPDNRSRKWTPDHEESFPPEKQVEVAYEETKAIVSRKKSVHNEQIGACHENRRNACGEESKSGQHNYEQKAAGMPNIKFREGGDGSDMSISSPDSSNAQRTSRSYSPAKPTEHHFDRIAHQDSYMNCPVKEPYESLTRVTHQGSSLPSKEEYFGAHRKQNDHMYADVNGSFYSSQHLSNSADVPMQGYGAGYGQGGDSYLQTHLGRHSLGSSGDRFSQPASRTPAFGLSGASSQRGLVMDKYAYGLMGPSGLPSSVIDKYSLPLDGTNPRPKSLSQQYPLGQSGPSGGRWPQN